VESSSTGDSLSAATLSSIAVKMAPPQRRVGGAEQSQVLDYDQPAKRRDNGERKRRVRGKKLEKDAVTGEQRDSEC
jgi:hypothetical protein